MSIPIATLIAAIIAAIAAIIATVGNFVIARNARRDNFLHIIFAQKRAVFSEVSNELTRITLHWDNIASGVLADPSSALTDIIKEIRFFQEQTLPRCLTCANRYTIEQVGNFLSGIDSNSSMLKVGQIDNYLGNAINAMRHELALDKIEEETYKVLGIKIRWPV